MAEPIIFLSFVEDEATRWVADRILAYLCDVTGLDLRFQNGHPVVTRGCGNLKAKAQKLLVAARSGVNGFLLADLDNYQTPTALGKDWLNLDCLSACPPNFIFRISIREIESWILADRDAIASFLGISVAAFPHDMDSLPDPKQFLLNTIRAKCKKRCHREMLPEPGQTIGIGYNSMLGEFIKFHWSPIRASAHSTSLNRSLNRVIDMLKTF